jgi:hypothetical protein
MLNPQTARTLTDQRREELRSVAAECRRTPAHRFSHWHVSWSRTRLSPEPSKGSSLVIIVSASRAA